MSTRKFSLVSVGGKAAEGTFTGASPLSAAKKAFNKWCRDNGRKTCVSTAIVVQEIGGKGKEYKYYGERRKMTPPKTITRGGKDVVYEYEATVKSKK